METNEIIRLQHQEEKKLWRKPCEMLWIDVFGDREQFVEHYMDSTWKRNQVLLLLCPKAGMPPANTSGTSGQLVKEKTIASMLHMNPYVLQVGEEKVNVHYIVGVCTKEELRGRGYMGTLLKEALRILNEQGVPFAYLMPAAVEIYLPYQFVPVGFAEKMICLVTRKQEELVAAELLIVPFGNLSGEERKMAVRLAGESREGIYVPPTEDYLRELETQTHTYEGELITVWQNSEPVGMVAYLYEEGETPVEVIQIFTADGYEEQVCELFHGYICERFRAEQIQIQYDDISQLSKRDLKDTEILRMAEIPRNKCITMIRCLDPVWFLGRLQPQPGWNRSCIIEIKDDILSENNRVYRVVFGADDQKNEVAFSEELPECCLSVETLVKYVLDGMSVYTPELV
ncbi:MAG: GNAT family N-acetyltransferase [Lachnospiraceae bacterium]|nr:GNAT family N-acetyltransferase [Lachnospiraceae bacterium]